MITVATEEDTFSIDGDLSMTLEDLKAILEADVSADKRGEKPKWRMIARERGKVMGTDFDLIITSQSNIPSDAQELYCNGNPLTEPTATLQHLGVKEDDLILLRSKAPPTDGRTSQRSTGASRPALSGEDEVERLRQDMLGNAPLMAQLRATRPDLAEAITSQPQRFMEMLRAERERNAASQMTQAQLAAADEFDIDAQRRIEEAIRQEAVMENFGSAMEFNPESFGRVTMLYVETAVNGQPVKAFVDSGAQATIMSPECAERCGIMRLIDTRFAGIARGVGTAKILGRVHSAQIKLGDELYLPCSFTIMEGRTTELLFGLDMLKRHACVLDMAKNALIVHGRSIRFLDEHELPASARMDGEEEGDEATGSSSTATGLGADAADANAAARAGAGQSFPGSGQTLASGGNAGAGPSTQSGFSGMSWDHPIPRQSAQGSDSTAPTVSTTGESTSSRSWPPASMQALKDLGATDVQAKALLDAAGGNVEVAASLLFQQ